MFRKLADLLVVALEQPTSQRDAFLVDQCGDDSALLREARSLVAVAEETSVGAVTANLQAQVGQAAMSATSIDDNHPEWIGPYRILEVVGSGGMGVVFRAEQLEPIRREVALKLIRSYLAGPTVVARFEAERQALALMNHPNIAQVYDAGATPDRRPYFVMELVDGEPITSFCDRHRTDITARLRLFVDVCRAVQHAHQKGIIHRDLKPANVLVAFVDGHPVAKVIDFGIAKATAFEGSATTPQTEQGTVMGTLEYMSPEQTTRAAGDIDTRSDVYSLGAMLYEVVAGHLPLDPGILRGASLPEAQRIIQDTDPPPPSRRIEDNREDANAAAEARSTDRNALRRQVRGDLDWVIMKALEKGRNRRYQSASELAEELERVIADEPVLAGPPSARYRMAKFVRRHRTGVAAAAAVLIVVLAGAVSSTVGFVRASTARRAAERDAARVLAVNEFLTDMLASAQPDQARGRELTVREVLDSAAAKLERDSAFADDPEIEATLRTTIGDTYTALGEYDRGFEFVQRALDIRRSIFDPTDERLVNALDKAGENAWLKGDLERSLEFALEMLEIRLQTVGRTHNDYASALNNVGNIYADLGRYDESELALREALAVDRATLQGEERRRLAYTLNNLAAVLADQEKYAEAVEFHHESLALRRELMGDDSPEVAVGLANMGFALEGAGDLAAAESTLTAAVEAAERVFGADHPRTAAPLATLGSVVAKRGRPREAEAHLRRALEIYETSTGLGSWRVGAIRARIGKLLASEGQPERAETELRAALSILSAALGAESERVRDVEEALAALDGSQPDR